MQISKKGKIFMNRYKATILVTAIFLSVFLSFFLYQWRITNAIKNDHIHHDAFFAGILKNDPSQLQNLFLEDLKNGVNDKYTKSDAYFITHRYFDNGGNIYEIYDYVNAHPELAFLKEAEGMYPDVFEQIKGGIVPKVFNDRATHAYLAYVEVLMHHGYTDIAAEGTLANQYAKLALFNVSIAKKMQPEDTARIERASKDSSKADQFLKLANQDVANVMDGKITSKDVTDRDILVGLNQYGAALRYMEVLQGASSTDFSIKKSKEIFDYAMMFARKNVPELYLFTSLLNASTLAIMDEHDAGDVRAALYSWMDIDLSKAKYGKQSVLYKVLNSKYEQQPTNPTDVDLDIYGKINTVRLASEDPSFKMWLMKNGWTESDFTINKK